MRKLAIWAGRALMGIFLFIAGVGPDEAQSNISHWFSVAGWQEAAAATESLTVHPAIIWVCAALLVLSFAPQAGRAIAATGWPANRPTKPSPEHEARVLASRADQIVRRFNLHRSPFVDAESADPLANIFSDAVSLLLTFQKRGLAVPNLSNLPETERKVGAIIEYFTRMAPLLRDGHLDEAPEVALHVAKQVIEP